MYECAKETADDHLSPPTQEQDKMKRMPVSNAQVSMAPYLF